MRVAVDRTRCIGAGWCVVSAAGVFEQAPDDGLVLLVEPSPGAARAHDLEAAVSACPSGAITVED